MSAITTWWCLEFSAQSIGQAIDLVRGHTPVGEAVRSVQEAGRLGYEVRASDGDWIRALRDDLAGHGHTTILEREG